MTASLNEAANEIFRSALQAVDARAAIGNAMSCELSRLRIRDTEIDIADRSLYVIGFGKAAGSMALGLNDVLGNRIQRGVLSALPFSSAESLPGCWQTFAGGHPLPNSQSIEAAKAAVSLLQNIIDDALIFFLVSGGGSAMFELPVAEGISLDDLREANRQLVSCGAAIAEINAVRRAFSAVKGGKLAAIAPHADQITLVVSDVNEGAEAEVASGPAFNPERETPATEIVKRCGLDQSLPASIREAIYEQSFPRPLSVTGLRQHYVLLSNDTAIAAAADKARQLGFAVEIATDINEQDVSAGSEVLVSRALSLSAGGKSICLISGGEFSCPVRGAGIGGRNSETVLRCALDFAAAANRGVSVPEHWLVMSTGTDGIDGNSPAAGAIADETTLARAVAAGLDATLFLKRSDSYDFFQQLGDAIVTGATGTNVRDLRLILI